MAPKRENGANPPSANFQFDLVLPSMGRKDRLACIGRMQCCVRFSQRLHYKVSDLAVATIKAPNNDNLGMAEF